MSHNMKPSHGLLLTQTSGRAVAAEFQISTYTYKQGEAPEQTLPCSTGERKAPASPSQEGGQGWGSSQSTPLHFFS